MQKEITVSELLHKLGEWKNYLLTKWLPIVLAGFIGTISGISYAYFSKKIYQAELSFALEEKSGTMGAYAGIASQLGIDVGKGGEGGAFVGDNIIELFRSRLIIEKTLLSEANFDGQPQLLVNRFIQFNELDKKLESNENTKGIKFSAGQSRKEFTRQQDSVMFGIFEHIRKKALSVEKIDKKLNIIIVRVKSTDEQFAKLFTEVLAANVYDFYTETKTKKTKKNVELLQARVDSVRNALNEEMYGAAMSQDENLNPSRAKVRVPFAKRQLNIELLTTVYGELIKNLELSKLTLMREEPLIQIIDKPIYPLRYIKPGKVSTGLTMGMLFGIAAVLFFIIQKLYRDSLDAKSA